MMPAYHRVQSDTPSVSRKPVPVRHSEAEISVVSLEEPEPAAHGNADGISPIDSPKDHILKRLEQSILHPIHRKTGDSSGINGTSTEQPIFQPIINVDDIQPPIIDGNTEKHAPIRIVPETRLGPPWAPEVTALVISLGALVAITILLIYENGRPLNHWTISVSLNTVVSILGVVSHAFLGYAISAFISQEKWNWFKRHADQVLGFRIFDDASRGPWGSIKLAWWLRFKHLATIGAITTVMLLGFDPFLQAIITYDGELNSVEEGPAVSIPGTTRLVSGVYKSAGGQGAVGAYRIGAPFDTTITANAFISQPDMGMASSVFSGFGGSSASTKFDPAINCATGNCTWPLYTSLAVCSACNDISSHVIKSIKSGNPGQGLDSSSQQFNVSYTNFAIPNSDLYIANFDGLAQLTSPSGLDFHVTSMAAMATQNHSATISFLDNLNVISALTIMRADDDYKNGKIPWQNTSITATECALYLCTNLYSSRVDQGQFNETAVASWSNRNMDSFQTLPTDKFPPLSIPLSKAWSAMYGDPFVFSNGDYSRTDLQLNISNDDLAQYSVQDSVHTTFNVSQDAIGSMVIWIQSFFTNGRLLYGVDAPLTGQPPVTQSLGTSNNLTETFANVSQSMTSWIRNSAGEPQSGTMSQWIIHMNVRWGFLAWPWAMVIAGSFFVIFSILQTMRRDTPFWKSDVLAAMVYGFDEQQRGELRFAAASGNMGVAARRMIVQLGEGGNGPQLKTVDYSR